MASVMWVLEPPSRIVYPSGRARATTAAPSELPPPPWFSTTTVPRSGFIFSAHGRPTASYPPPGGKGTMSRIGRSGYVLCAKATRTPVWVETAANPRARRSRLLMALSIANPSDLTGLKPHDHAHLNGCRFARADDILFTKEANDSISRHAQLGEEGLSPTKPQRPPVQLLLE